MQETIIGHKSTYFSEVTNEKIKTRKSATDYTHQPVYEEKNKKTWTSISEIPFLLTNADILLRHNEKEMARTLVYKALSIDSNHPVALRKAAQILGPSGNIKQLTKIHEGICKSDYSFESVAELANLYYKQGQDSIALEKYYEALGILVTESSLLFDVYKNIGNILIKESDYEGAEEYYNKAYAINPKSDSLLINLGTLEIQRKDTQLAMTRFQQALETNPKNAKAWIGLSLVHQMMSELTLAMASAENAFELDSASKTAVHLLANLAVTEGKPKRAIECLQEYLASVDIDAEMSFVLVHLYCQTSQFEFALLEIERIMLWDPKNSDAAALEKEIKKMIKDQI